MLIINTLFSCFLERVSLEGSFHGKVKFGKINLQDKVVLSLTFSEEKPVILHCYVKQKSSSIIIAW